MRFLRFIKEHWKVASILLAIMIATGVGVAVVSASTAAIKFDPPKVVFTREDMNNKKIVTAKVTLDNAGFGQTNYCEWIIKPEADQSVAAVDGNDLTAEVTPLSAGKTSITLNVWADITQKDNNDPDGTRDISVEVPLIISHDRADGVFWEGRFETVSCNAKAGSVVTWTSGNNEIATVEAYPDDNSVATVTAHKGGKTTITAVTQDGMTDSFDVTVGVKITDKGPEGNGFTIRQGDPDFAISTNSADSSSVYWWSDNDNVATVSNGLVHAVYAGTTQVYASCRDHVTDDGAGDFVNITVPYEVTFPSSEADPDAPITLIVGDQIEVRTTAKPDEVTFTSDDDNVIHSEEAKRGLFTARNAGTTVIHVVRNGDDRSKVIKVIDGFAISNKKISLNLGKSQDLTVYTSSDSEITWEMNDPSIADFTPVDDRTVTVTAKAAGVTTLTASQVIDGIRKTVSCEIHALNPVNSLTLMRDGVPIDDTITVSAGTSTYITAYLNFEDSVMPEDTTLSWISSDTGILTIEPQPVEEGQGLQQLCKVTGVSGGQATVTVVSEDGLKIATADFYVTEGIDSITLDQTSVTAQMSLKNYQLTAAISPDSPGVDKTIVWASLDTSVLEVNNSGLVTFKAPGTTYVSATSAADPTKVAYCQFTITQQVDGVKMDFERVTMNVGDDYRLTAVVSPANSTDPSLTWSSSNPAIVTVDENGMLHAVSSGSATIVVKTNDGGFIDMTNVTVLQPVASIKLSQTEMSVKKGTVFWLDATVEPDTANNRNVRWTSSDTSLATVDDTGMVTTLGVGTVTISCTSEDNGTVAYCIVDITEQVTGITLNTSYQEMITGTKFVIVPTIEPLDAPNKNVTYVSSSPDIATVDENGIVTAVAKGECEIAVTTEESSLTAKCTIVVRELVKSVEISADTDKIYVGDTIQLTADVKEDTASDKRIEWSSNDTSCAAVDSTGRVTGIGSGSVVITAAAVDGGGAFDTYTLNVINPVKYITLDKTSAEVYVGEVVNISATITPQDATIKDITWQSDDESIAKVNSAGNIEGVAPGSTTVHAYSSDGTNVVADCVITVKEYVKSIEITGNRDNLNVGDFVKLKAVVKDESASDKSIIWTTSDSSRATVDSEGKVTGISPGSVVITATAADGGGASNYVVIRVINPVTSISLSSSKITIFEGETVNIAATVNPQNASIKGLVWTSDNEAVAKVYSDGDVEGIAPGRTVIHATSTDGNNVVADCTVIVKQIIKATSIDINSSDIVMLKGKTRKLTARIYPKNTNESVKWLSTDTSIVQVDGNGNIVTVGAGECQVVAYSSAGTVQDTCTVHSLAMYCTNLKLEQYDSYNLYVDGAPSEVSWRSSNPRIASVDQTGKVIGRMPGECVITATVSGKSVTCYVKVMAVDPGKFINKTQ